MTLSAFKARLRASSKLPRQRNASTQRRKLRSSSATGTAPVFWAVFSACSNAFSASLQSPLPQACKPRSSAILKSWAWLKTTVTQMIEANFPKECIRNEIVRNPVKVEPGTPIILAQREALGNGATTDPNCGSIQYAGHLNDAKFSRACKGYSKRPLTLMETTTIAGGTPG